MRSIFSALAGATLAIALATAASAAPSGVSTVMLLHGHLPDLGNAPSLHVFQSAAAYDDFHRGLGGADIFPAASALSVSFERSVLALYARGSDVGNRCLAAQSLSGVSGDTVELALTWQDGTCGAPAGARYPFILVSLSRQGNDGVPWIGTVRSVCASAAGIDVSRACDTVAGTGPSASPRTPAPSAAAPAPVPTASPVSVAPPRPEPAPAPMFLALGIVQSVGLFGMGLIVGVVLTMIYTRWRRAHGARTGVTTEQPMVAEP